MSVVDRAESSSFSEWNPPRPPIAGAPDRAVWFGFVLILLAASALVLIGLGHTSLWNDESFVAISARNFVHFHRLTSWDGRNLYAEGDGNYTDPQLRNGNPPLDILTAALSFRLLGVSVWTARLPFALFGVATLALFWCVLRREFPGKPALWLYGLAGLAFSCEFLLNVRTCRYYALGLFFSLLAFACWRRCLRTRRTVDFLALGVAAVLLFYTHYLLCAAFLAALISIHLAFHARDFTRTDWSRVALAAALFAVAVGPYLVIHPVWAYRANLTAPHEPWLHHRLILIGWNIIGLNLMGSLPWAVALGLLVLLVRRYLQDPLAWQIAEWAALGLGYAVFLGLLSPQPTTIRTFADLRYLIPAVPLTAGLIGILLWMVHQRTRVGAVCLLLLLTTSNVTTLGTPFARFTWLLPSYVQEISHPYPTANAAVSTFLRHNAHQDDVVLTSPQYLNYPLLFSNGDQIRIGCVLDEATPLPLDTVRRLHAPLMKSEHYPNWVVLYGTNPGDQALLHYFSRPHTEQGQPTTYHYRRVQTLDVYWDQTQRPELPLHRFGPVTCFNRITHAVNIYKRFP